MQDCRCPRCGRLLFRGQYERIETRCPRCRRMVEVRAQDKETGARTSTVNNRPETP